MATRQAVLGMERASFFYGSAAVFRGIAQQMLREMADLIQSMAGSDVVVRYAHMELAEPSIATAKSRLRRSPSRSV